MGGWDGRCEGGSGGGRCVRWGGGGGRHERGCIL